MERILRPENGERYKKVISYAFHDESRDDYILLIYTKNGQVMKQYFPPYYGFLLRREFEKQKKSALTKNEFKIVDMRKRNAIKRALSLGSAISILATGAIHLSRHIGIPDYNRDKFEVSMEADSEESIIENGFEGYIDDYLRIDTLIKNEDYDNLTEADINRYFECAEKLAECNIQIKDIYSPSSYSTHYIENGKMGEIDDSAYFFKVDYQPGIERNLDHWTPYLAYDASLDFGGPYQNRLGFNPLNARQCPNLLYDDNVSGEGLAFQINMVYILERQIRDTGYNFVQRNSLGGVVRRKNSIELLERCSERLEHYKEILLEKINTKSR